VTARASDERRRIGCRLAVVVTVAGIAVNMFITRSDTIAVICSPRAQSCARERFRALRERGS
jgi:hypothetical protein